MKIQQIRSAAIIVTYAGKRFLIDPWLGEKGTLPPLPFGPNQDKRNPMVELPIPLENIINVDAVVVTHLHFDHFDTAASEALPKNMPMFAQSNSDADALRNLGFNNISVFDEAGVGFDGITLARTKCEHGRGEKIAAIYAEFNIGSEASGLVFTHPKEKTLYIAGDTVWCEVVHDALKVHNPDVIVLNAGDARLGEDSPIIMGANDVYEVCKAAPKATVIASHMEAVNHAILTRDELKSFINKKGIASQVLVPDDGEVYSF